jgi:AbrB family looped-hinge helix DNA binding protein
MLVKMSSKGQLVIPKAVRRALRLEPGTAVRVRVVEKTIVLEPIADASPAGLLYGRYAGEDLIGAHEDEHRRELLSEQ